MATGQYYYKLAVFSNGYGGWSIKKVAVVDEFGNFIKWSDMNSTVLEYINMIQIPADREVIETFVLPKLKKNRESMED